MASSKLEDGDIKGAVRVLCSDDKLAVPANLVDCIPSLLSIDDLFQLPIRHPYKFYHHLFDQLFNLFQTGQQQALMA